jgi:hypothetical protein
MAAFIDIFGWPYCDPGKLAHVPPPLRIACSTLPAVMNGASNQLPGFSTGRQRPVLSRAALPPAFRQRVPQPAAAPRSAAALPFTRRSNTSAAAAPRIGMS